MALDRKQDDLHLVRRCQEGDRSALKQLYARHHGVLYAVSFRLTGHAADAEDVVQEAFIKAWRALPRFRCETTFKNWLIRIGVNLCRNLKKRRRETKSLEDTAAPIQDSDALAQVWLTNALGELPSGYREVLVLHDVMEFRHNEIADVLDISVGTSKSQLHRARTKMRLLLKKSRDMAGTTSAAGSGRQV